MGISKRICSENKVELRQLKAKATRILKFGEEYPEQLTMKRRMDLTVELNNIMERVEYLKRDKHANVREHPDENFEFHYVFKKGRVKNRKL
jgi:hypothetical protein